MSQARTITRLGIPTRGIGNSLTGQPFSPPSNAPSFTSGNVVSQAQAQVQQQQKVQTGQEMNFSISPQAQAQGFSIVGSSLFYQQNPTSPKVLAATITKNGNLVPTTNTITQPLYGNVSGKNQYLGSVVYAPTVTKNTIGFKQAGFRNSYVTVYENGYLFGGVPTEFNASSNTVYLNTAHWMGGGYVGSQSHGFSNLSGNYVNMGASVPAGFGLTNTGQPISVNSSTSAKNYANQSYGAATVDINSKAYQVTFNPTTGLYSTNAPSTVTHSQELNGVTVLEAQAAIFNKRTGELAYGEPTYLIRMPSGRTITATGSYLGEYHYNNTLYGLNVSNGQITSNPLATTISLGTSSATVVNHSGNWLFTNNLPTYTTTNNGYQYTASVTTSKGVPAVSVSRSVVYGTPMWGSYVASSAAQTGQQQGAALSAFSAGKASAAQVNLLEQSGYVLAPHSTTYPESDTTNGPVIIGNGSYLVNPTNKPVLVSSITASSPAIQLTQHNQVINTVANWLGTGASIASATANKIPYFSLWGVTSETINSIAEPVIPQAYSYTIYPNGESQSIYKSPVLGNVAKVPIAGTWLAQQTQSLVTYSNIVNGYTPTNAAGIAYSPTEKAYAAVGIGGIALNAFGTGYITGSITGIAVKAIGIGAAEAIGSDVIINSGVVSSTVKSSLAPALFFGTAGAAQVAGQRATGANVSNSQILGAFALNAGIVFATYVGARGVFAVAGKMNDVFNPSADFSAGMKPTDINYQIRAVGTGTEDYMNFVKPQLTAQEALSYYHADQVPYQTGLTVPPGEASIVTTPDYQIFFNGGKITYAVNPGAEDIQGAYESVYSRVTDALLGKGDMSTPALTKGGYVDTESFKAAMANVQSKGVVNFEIKNGIVQVKYNAGTLMGATDEANPRGITTGMTNAEGEAYAYTTSSVRDFLHLGPKETYLGKFIVSADEPGKINIVRASTFENKVTGETTTTLISREFNYNGEYVNENGASTSSWFAKEVGQTELGKQYTGLRIAADSKEPNANLLMSSDQVDELNSIRNEFNKIKNPTDQDIRTLFNKEAKIFGVKAVPAIKIVPFDVSGSGSTDFTVVGKDISTGKDIYQGTGEITISKTTPTGEANSNIEETIRHELAHYTYQYERNVITGDSASKAYSLGSAYIKLARLTGTAADPSILAENFEYAEAPIYKFVKLSEETAGKDIYIKGSYNNPDIISQSSTPPTPASLTITEVSQFHDFSETPKYASNLDWGKFFYDIKNGRFPSKGLSAITNNEDLGIPKIEYTSASQLGNMQGDTGTSVKTEQSTLTANKVLFSSAPVNEFQSAILAGSKTAQETIILPQDPTIAIAPSTLTTTNEPTSTTKANMGSSYLFGAAPSVYGPSTSPRNGVGRISQASSSESGILTNQFGVVIGNSNEVNLEFSTKNIGEATANSSTRTIYTTNVGQFVSPRSLVNPATNLVPTPPITHRREKGKEKISSQQRDILKNMSAFKGKLDFRNESKTEDSLSYELGLKEYYQQSTKQSSGYKQIQKQTQKTVSTTKQATNTTISFNSTFNNAGVPFNIPNLNRIPSSKTKRHLVRSTSRNYQYVTDITSATFHYVAAKGSGRLYRKLGIARPIL